MEEDGRRWKKMDEIGRRWKKLDEVGRIKKSKNVKKNLKSVGDHLGTLMGVPIAQKNNSESVTTRKKNQN